MCAAHEEYDPAYDSGSGRFTTEDPIGIAGGVNLYQYAGNNPANFSDPFGLCPEYAGGDGKNETAADCPREVLDSWAERKITLGPQATWDGVDPELRDAIIKASIQLNKEFHVYSTTGGTHSARSFHYHGLAADISRTDGRRFSSMALEEASGLGQAVGNMVLYFLPRQRWAEMIGPGFGMRFYREPWSADAAARLIGAHRSHVHISVLR